MQILSFRFLKAALWAGIVSIALGSLCLYLKRERVNKMLEYMEQKYGESFTALGPYAGQFGKEYSMLMVREDKSRIDGILVRAAEKGGKCLYQDNYLAYLLKEQIEQHMRELAEPIFGECKVFYKIPDMVFPVEFTADMEPEAFLKSPWSMVSIYLYIKEDSANRREQMEQFCSLLGEKQYLAGGVVSWPLDEADYQKITGKNFIRAAYIGYQYEAEAVFSVRDKTAPIYLKWKE